MTFTGRRHHRDVGARARHGRRRVQVNVTGTGNTDHDDDRQRRSSSGGTIGASGITFESVSSNGATRRHLRGRTRATLGGLTVTGDGTAAPNGSGGTLAELHGRTAIVRRTRRTSPSRSSTSTPRAATASTSQSVTDFLLPGRVHRRRGRLRRRVRHLIFEEPTATCWSRTSCSTTSTRTAIQLDQRRRNDDARPTCSPFRRRATSSDHTPAGFGEHGMDVQVSRVGGRGRRDRRLHVRHQRGRAAGRARASPRAGGPRRDRARLHVRRRRRLRQREHPAQWRRAPARPPSTSSTTT